MANRRRGLRNATSGDDERAYDFGLAGSADRGGERSPVVEGQQTRFCWFRASLIAKPVPR